MWLPAGVMDELELQLHPHSDVVASELRKWHSLAAKNPNIVSVNIQEQN
jgi:hypothetical protein